MTPEQIFKEATRCLDEALPTSIPFAKRVKLSRIRQLTVTIPESQENAKQIARTMKCLARAILKSGRKSQFPLDTFPQTISFLHIGGKKIRLRMIRDFVMEYGQFVNRFDVGLV
jgi:hypothetical protein